jgi:hypothetical protein
MLSDKLPREPRRTLMVLDEFKPTPVVGKPCRSFSVDLFLEDYARIAFRDYREYVETMIRFNSFASEAQIG